MPFLYFDEFLLLCVNQGLSKTNLYSKVGISHWKISPTGGVTGYVCTPYVLLTGQEISYRQTHLPFLLQTHGMVVKIRLARFGKRNAPFYNIVVARDRYLRLQSRRKVRNTDHRICRSARNSKPLEVLGEPHPSNMGEMYPIVNR